MSPYRAPCFPKQKLNIWTYHHINKHYFTDHFHSKTIVILWSKELEQQREVWLNQTQLKAWFSLVICKTHKKTILLFLKTNLNVHI